MTHPLQRLYEDHLERLTDAELKQEYDDALKYARTQQARDPSTQQRPQEPATLVAAEMKRRRLGARRNTSRNESRAQRSYRRYLRSLSEEHLLREIDADRVAQGSDVGEEWAQAAIQAEKARRQLKHEEQQSDRANDADQ